MSYSQNPYLPRVRAKAIQLIREEKWPVNKTANYLGVHRATVHRWLNKAPDSVGKIYEIPTQSSRPKTSPLAIDEKIVKRILEIRQEKNRCAEIIQAQLERENIEVSLSTVKRTLKRNGLIKEKSKWKKYHLSGERPEALKPGHLVEIDTIHIMLNKKKRIYIFTMLDCYSRWAYAKASLNLSACMATQTVFNANHKAPFNFKCVQTDHGPEFTNYFSKRITNQGMRHRLIRVRKPNDNAHVERFNRTIQDELKMDIIKYKQDLPKLNKLINEYMKYYNTERLHLGLGCKTPMEVLQSY